MYALIIVIAVLGGTVTPVGVAPRLLENSRIWISAKRLRVSPVLEALSPI